MILEISIICIPETMNGPGVIRPNWGIDVPKLGLQHLTTRIVETAGILAMVLSFTTNFGSWT